MKKIAFLLLTLALIFQLQAINDVHQHQKGLRELTTEDYQKIDKLPLLKLDSELKNRNLPYMVDNSGTKYFRPIFNQTGGCCSHASAIAYQLTYELSAVRDLDASLPENQYPTHFTWNFLNFGQEAGTWPLDAMFIARDNGIPNVVDYGGSLIFGGSERWMDGFYRYRRAMENRISRIYKINVRSEEGLLTLKNWFYDHLGEQKIGGIANFVANSSQMKIKSLAEGTPEAGKSVCTSWRITDNVTIADHAMTFVGYNDSIRYDFNGDGLYTNDLDINEDGVVDMKDWEIGALIVANSWGDWENDGFIYMPYRLCALDIFSGGTGERGNVYVFNVHKQYKPKLVYKVNIKHEARHFLKINAGIASDTNAETPEHILTFPIFTHQGGKHFMQGGTTEADKFLELGLDVTPLLSYVAKGENYKLFLEVIEKDPKDEASGEIVSFSVIDYENEEQVFNCQTQNTPITNNETTYLAVTKPQNSANLEILTENLPTAELNQPYEYQMQALGGFKPYNWSLKMNYTEETGSESLPDMSSAEDIAIPGESHHYVTKNLNFSFPFYNKSYDKIIIDSNGAIIFDDTYCYSWTYEDMIIQNRAVAPYLAELINENSAIKYLEKENSVVIKWQGKSYHLNAKVEFACELFQDGTIKFYYGDLSQNPISWSGGISNGDKGNYLITTLADRYEASFKSTTITPDYSFDTFSKFDITQNGKLAASLTTAETYQLPLQLVDASAVKRVKSLTLSTGALNSSYLVIDSLIIDSTLVAGRENTISLRIKNIGGIAAENNVIKLMTEEGELASIDSDSLVVETIASDESLIIENAFTFTPQVSNKEKLNLKLYIKDIEKILSYGFTPELENINLQFSEIQTMYEVHNQGQMILNFLLTNKSNVSCTDLAVTALDLSDYSADLNLSNSEISQINNSDSIQISINCDITDIPTDKELVINLRGYLRENELVSDEIFIIPVKHFVSETGFENGLPESWTFIDNNNDGETWNIDDDYDTIVAADGGNYLYLDAEENEADDWIILPALDAANDMRISFKARSRVFIPRGKITLKRSVTGANPADFTEVIAEEKPNMSWQDISYTIPASKGSQYLAIHCTNPAGSILYLDDFHFETVVNEINDENITVNDNFLFQNYPNPFNPETTIKFNLVTSGNVDLNIFNVKGELVKTVYRNRDLRSGIHTLAFEAGNLPSGIYYYGLALDGKTVGIKKMILLK